MDGAVQRLEAGLVPRFLILTSCLSFVPPTSFSFFPRPPSFGRLSSDAGAAVRCPSFPHPGLVFPCFPCVTEVEKALRRWTAVFLPERRWRAEVVFCHLLA